METKTLLGDIGSATVKIDIPATSGIVLCAALIVPILVYFICKALI